MDKLSINIYYTDGSAELGTIYCDDPTGWWFEPKDDGIINEKQLKHILNMIKKAKKMSHE